MSGEVPLLLQEDKLTTAKSVFTATVSTKLAAERSRTRLCVAAPPGPPAAPHSPRSGSPRSGSASCRWGSVWPDGAPSPCWAVVFESLAGGLLAASFCPEGDMTHQEEIRALLPLLPRERFTQREAPLRRQRDTCSHGRHFQLIQRPDLQTSFSCLVLLLIGLQRSSAGPAMSMTVSIEKPTETAKPRSRLSRMVLKNRDVDGVAHDGHGKRIADDLREQRGVRNSRRFESAAGDRAEPLGSTEQNRRVLRSRTAIQVVNKQTQRT
ncbi:hypothetical protein EYF80_053482 [Liparis tanakae]|uniref:Uncharacterized protein n=1 Tax=Liparis tanakae TaxID=230148 RepID=A0A4Z2F6F6_9TELE|nr:hypothetical protein EYF80_053482 [Liparis tanakae]